MTRNGTNQLFVAAGLAWSLWWLGLGLGLGLCMFRAARLPPRPRPPPPCREAAAYLAPIHRCRGFRQLYSSVNCSQDVMKLTRSNTQYAIRNTQYAIRNTQCGSKWVGKYAIRNTQYAIRNTQYAIRNTQYAMRVKEGWPVRNRQHAIHNTQRGSMWAGCENCSRYAIANTQYAIRNAGQQYAIRKMLKNTPPKIRCVWRYLHCCQCVGSLFSYKSLSDACVSREQCL